MNTDGMPTEQLDAIEQCANAAARGPWWNDGHEIHQGAPEDVDPLWIGETCNLDLLDKGDANAAFIAAARQAVPDLVAEVRRLTAALAAEQTAHEDTSTALASYRLLAPRLQQQTEKAQAEATALRIELRATHARLAELEPLAGRCGHESRGRRCDQSAGHPGDHQALTESSVSYVWARS